MGALNSRAPESRRRRAGSPTRRATASMSRRPFGLSRRRFAWPSSPDRRGSGRGSLRGDATTRSILLAVDRPRQLLLGHVPATPDPKPLRSGAELLDRRAVVVHPAERFPPTATGRRTAQGSTWIRRALMGLRLPV